MLARMCALAVHNVKGSFLSTYKDVPWEEMEYLLVMFIEARTVLQTLARKVIITAASTAAHLRCFRERLEKYVLVHRAEPDLEAAMRRLKKEPRKERAALLGAVVDSALAELRKDFALLRDLHSLKEINKVLGVTSEALRSLEDDAWAAWGWLGLRWALFVVGERVKYSWLSPNLSPRWAVLVEAMAPGGVLKVMAAIRDDQEHGEDGSNAKTLALSEMKQSERKELAEELERLRNAALAALVGAREEVLENDEYFSYEDISLGEALATRDNAAGAQDFIVEQVIKLLKPAESVAKEEFDKIVMYSVALKAANTSLIKPLFTVRICNCLVASRSHFQSLAVLFAKAYIPQILPRVLRLFSRSTDGIIRFQNDLNKITQPTKSSHQLTIIREAIKAISNVTAPLAEFAFLGGLRELSSRWHEHEMIVPTTVPFSPALFGRQLRNYLNHLDEVFTLNTFPQKSGLHLFFLEFEHPNACLKRGTITSFSCPFELEKLRSLLLTGVLPLKSNGARPRPRDPRWCRSENDRLLRLVELKSDMFRCAREGDLGELQRLVEEEDDADLGVRDCIDRTLLHAAAQGGQAHVVKWLLGLGAEAVDPLDMDWCGRTALHVATTADVAEALLFTGEGRGAWMPTAAGRGHSEVVGVLLRDRRDHNEDQDHSLLYQAARGGHDQVVRVLLEAGVQSKAGEETKPLVAAVRSGSVRTLRLLLGASPPPSDEDCWKATKQAAEQAHEEAVNILLHKLKERARERGQRLRAPDEAVLAAVVGGNIEVTLRLLKLCPGALSRRLISEVQCSTVFHAAALLNRAALVRTLLGRVADPPLTASDGVATLLDCAAGNSCLDTIDVLVKHTRKRGGEADGSLRAALGQALFVAARIGQLEGVKRLAHHGADIHAVDQCGQTLLTEAASYGRTEVVQWLLQHGADPRLGTLPALHAAAMCGQLDVVKLLVPPLHAGDQAQDDPPGGEEPSALSVAVQAGSRKDLQRILGRFVEHLRPLSSRYTREDRLRDKAEAAAALRRKEREEDERLRLLQQFESNGDTAVLCAAVVSDLPVVEYLLEREGELLRRVYSKHKNTGVPRLDGLTVYARGANGDTALQCGAVGLCGPSVAEALLRRMGDEMWLALGHRDLQEVRGMAVEALEVAATRPDGGPLIRTLCGWVSSKGEGLLGAEGLQDIRRRAVAALGSGQDEEWSRVLLLLRRVPLELVAASEADLRHLQRAAALAMSASLQKGARGEMAVQLLCQWVCDLSEDAVPEDKLLGMVSEAMRISEGRDGRLFALYRSVMADYFLSRR